MPNEKTTPSEPVGLLPIDDRHTTGMSLVDRDCVILDGTCKCLIPFEHCKYIKIKKEIDD